jgi:hypothetical protein
MKSSYISYFEGYDAEGRIVYNGNGSVTVEHGAGQCVNPDELKDQHCAYILEKATDQQPCHQDCDQKPDEL